MADLPQEARITLTLLTKRRKRILQKEALAKPAKAAPPKKKKVRVKTKPIKQSSHHSPTISPEGRKKIRELFEKGAKNQGVGMLPPEGCKQLLGKMDTWSDWQWVVIGMQVGVLPS